MRGSPPGLMPSPASPSGGLSTGPPRPRGALDDALPGALSEPPEAVVVAQTRRTGHEIHVAPATVGVHRRRGRLWALVAAVLGLALACLEARWDLRPDEAAPTRTVVEVRPVVPPGGFALSVEQMGPSLARLLPDRSRRLVASTAYADTTERPARVVLVGSVRIGDGAARSLVRVTLARVTSSLRCPDAASSCRILGDGTLVRTWPSSLLVVTTPVRGLEVTAQVRASPGPLPLSVARLRRIANAPVWAGSKP